MSRCLVMLAAVGMAGMAWAVEFAKPFGDGAVLQRGAKVPVWGTAKPGETVKVSFGGVTRKTVAGTNGCWRVDLPPMEASKVGRTLSANGAEAKDILVGEVWFCAGQSNMECPLTCGNPYYRDRDGGLVGQLIRRPLVRLHHPYRPDWERMDRKALFDNEDSFSALGTYFAFLIHDAIDVPVGIVGAYVGGTGVDYWTPGEKGAAGWRKQVEPWTPYAIRGLIWYQGEHDAGYKGNWGYCEKMHTFYRRWAERFENPDLRLRFVQIAPYDSSADHVTLQMAQEKFAREERNAAMASAVDLGNLRCIHPCDKLPLALRLAALSLKYDYGFSDIEADSPTLRSWTVENGAFRLEFDHVRRWSIYNREFTTDVGFELAGADGVWHKAKVVNLIPGDPWRCGQVKDRFLIVKSDEVAEPKALRYLFSKPWYGSLQNESNLPLGPFSIGDQKIDGAR